MPEKTLIHPRVNFCLHKSEKKTFFSWRISGEKLHLHKVIKRSIMVEKCRHLNISWNICASSKMPLRVFFSFFYWPHGNMMLLLLLCCWNVSALDKIHGAGECVAPLYVMLMIHTALKWSVRLIIYLDDELPYLS